MPAAAMTTWTPGTQLPYVIPLGDGQLLAIALRAQWLKADRSGRPLLLPPAVRALDRLRAVFATQEIMTPGFITSLREAMNITQADFGRRVGASKMTVSRWECGKMRPGAARTRAILRLQRQARRQGMRIDVAKLR